MVVIKKIGFGSKNDIFYDHQNGGHKSVWFLRSTRQSVVIPVVMTGSLANPLVPTPGPPIFDVNRNSRPADPSTRSIPRDWARPGHTDVLKRIKKLYNYPFASGFISAITSSSGFKHAPTNIDLPPWQLPSQVS